MTACNIRESSGRRLLRRVKTLGLDVVRRGPRSVLWTPPKVYLGNHLYYWLHTLHSQLQGEDVRTLVSDEMEPWRSSFPAVFRDLTLDRSGVMLKDRRIAPGAMQTFGAHFDRGSLDRFIDDYVLGDATGISQVIDRMPNTSDVTINVRRGDYYSVPKWRGTYSFDVVEFVRSAFKELSATGPISNIRLISDDLEWCRVKLGWLSEIAPVSFPPSGATSTEHLAALATSPRLVLANSSFSYWGGYMSTWRAERGLNGDCTGVWAPAFNSRALPNGGRATQLHPAWNIIEHIPGGWDG